MIVKPLKTTLLSLLFFITLINSYRCAKNTTNDTAGFSDAAIKRIFGNNISINSPENYANQSIPAYINADNGSVIDDKKAIQRKH